jgi:hypothetical protein
MSVAWLESEDVARAETQRVALGLLSHPAAIATVEKQSVRSLIRACIASALGVIERVPASKIVARQWPKDHIAHWIVRSPVSPQSTQTDTPLISTVMPDLISTLAPTSVAASLFREGLQLSFNQAGSIAVPTIIGNSTYSAFVKEGDPIPIVQGDFEPLVFLEPRKLATIVVLTTEMILSSNVEALIADALIRSTGMALDLALLDNLPGDDTRPAGIRYGVAPVAASTAPDPVAALMQDIEILRRELAETAIAHPVYVMGKTRALMAELRSTHGLAPLVILGSRALKGTMIMMAISPDNLVSVFGDKPEVMASRHTTGDMNTAPDGQFITRSMWQTDCVAIRIRLPVTWAVRSPLGVSWTVTTNW